MIRLTTGKKPTLEFDSPAELWALFSDRESWRGNGHKPRRRKRRKGNAAGWSAAKRRARQLGRTDVAAVRRELAAEKKRKAK